MDLKTQFGCNNILFNVGLNAIGYIFKCLISSYWCFKWHYVI